MKERTFILLQIVLLIIACVIVYGVIELARSDHKVIAFIIAGAGLGGICALEAYWRKKVK